MRRMKPNEVYTAKGYHLIAKVYKQGTTMHQTIVYREVDHLNLMSKNHATLERAKIFADRIAGGKK